MRFTSFTPASVSRSAPSTFRRCVVWSSLNVAPSVSYDGEVKVFQVAGGHGGRCSLEQRARGGRLRERDDITQRRGASNEHGDPIETERNTAVGRRSGA